tara:strand:+ start:1261 stop:1767 length:507 start_codon:yes stop_codon:yes gene_type:complete
VALAMMFSLSKTFVVVVGGDRRLKEKKKKKKKSFLYSSVDKKKKKPSLLSVKKKKRPTKKHPKTHRIVGSAPAKNAHEYRADEEADDELEHRRVRWLGLFLFSFLRRRLRRRRRLEERETERETGETDLKDEERSRGTMSGRKRRHRRDDDGVIQSHLSKEKRRPHDG